MQNWLLVLVHLIWVVNAARDLVSSGYDGNNWPASLVMDTSRLSDSSDQHDQFYGGGSPSSSQSFDQSTTAENRNFQTTQSTRRQQFMTSTRTPRPEFTPTTTRRMGEREHQTTIAQQSEDYSEQKQGWRTTDGFDNRRNWQTSRPNRPVQNNRRPLSENENYDSSSSSDFANLQNENLSGLNQQNDNQENRQWSSSRDNLRQRILPTPGGYDLALNRDLNRENAGRRTQRPAQNFDYDTRSDSRMTSRPSPINEQKAKLVAKLFNIDRSSGYSQDSEDGTDHVENITPPSSPFRNDTEFSTSSTTASEINEILTRPLNSSDQPFEDKNLQRATLEIIKLLHDEPHSHQTANQKDTVKVGKKVRVIHLPPMSTEDESEEIVLVGERGNATIHRGRNSMSIHATSKTKKHRL